MITAENLAEIESEGRRLLEAARRDPNRAVPQYPSWTLADLAAHTASVHALAALVCRDLPTERVSRPRLPPGKDALDWFEQNHADLLEVLRRADPKSPCWGFGPGSNVNRWKDRIVVETGVHRWDAHQALGERGDLTEMVARSGLEEFAGMWFPMLPDVQTLHVTAMDLGQDFVFGDGVPAVFIEGTASDIYLSLMSRPSAVVLPGDWAKALEALPPPPAG